MKTVHMLKRRCCGGFRFLYEKFRSEGMQGNERTGSWAKVQHNLASQGCRDLSVEGPPLYQMMSECHITHMAMANPLSIHLYTGSALPRTCTGDPSFISSTENKSKSTTLVCIVSPEEMSTVRASLTCR